MRAGLRCIGENGAWRLALRARAARIGTAMCALVDPASGGFARGKAGFARLALRMCDQDGGDARSSSHQAVRQRLEQPQEIRFSDRPSLRGGQRSIILIWSVSLLLHDKKSAAHSPRPLEHTPPHPPIPTTTTPTTFQPRRRQRPPARSGIGPRTPSRTPATRCHHTFRRRPPLPQ